MGLCQQNGIDVMNRTTVPPTAGGGGEGSSGASSSTIAAVAIVVAVVVAVAIIAMVVRAKIIQSGDGALRAEGGKFKRFDTNPHYELEDTDHDACDIVDTTNAEDEATGTEAFA